MYFVCRFTLEGSLYTVLQTYNSITAEGMGQFVANMRKEQTTVLYDSNGDFQQAVAVADFVPNN